MTIARKMSAGQAIPSVIWLPFLDTYGTMCLAPGPPFRLVLEDFRAWN